MKYTSQKWYCNNCGKEQNSQLTGIPTNGTYLTKDGFHCSKICLEEFRLKQANSNSSR
jgi:hypothetical protein